MKEQSANLRPLRYEGTQKPYFYLAVPDTENEDVRALMLLLHDYGYRFFVPLPGDEDLGGDSGFFFKDERMEQARRMLVVLPAQGTDHLLPYEEQGLREWLNHHPAADVLVVHLGAGEATGALTELLEGTTHLRPGKETGEEFLQRLLDQLLPPEYDPRHDRSLRPDADAEAITAMWRQQAVHRGRVLLAIVGGILLAMPFIASMAIAPPWREMGSYLGCAADLLLIAYGLVLLVMLMICDGFPLWHQPWMKELKACCPSWYVGLRPVARTLRMIACGLLWASITPRLMMAEGGTLIDRLTDALWLSVSGLGLWTVMESALAMVAGDGLSTPRGERRQEAAMLGSVLFVLLMLGRMLFGVQDTPETVLPPLLTLPLTLGGLTAFGHAGEAWSHLVRGKRKG